MKILSIDAFIEKLNVKPLSFDDLDKLGIIKYDVKCFDIAQLKNLDYFMVFKGQIGLMTLSRVLGDNIVGYRSQISSPGILLTLLDNGRVCRIPLNYYKEDLVCREFPEDYTIMKIWHPNPTYFDSDIDAKTISKQMLKQIDLAGFVNSPLYEEQPYYKREK